MKPARARLLARSAFVFWAACWIANASLVLATKPIPNSAVGTAAGDILFALLTSTFSIVAFFVLVRQPGNRIGWILMTIGVLWILPLETYGIFAISRGLPGGPVFVSLSGPTWAPPIVLMGTSLLLRFPDGELLSRRWRWVEWIAAGGLVLVCAAVVFSPGNLADSGFPKLANPLGAPSLEPVLNVAYAGLLLIPATIVASAVSLVIRFRRSKGTERLQMKWLSTAGAIVAVLYLLAMFLSIDNAWSSAAPTWLSVIQNLSVSSFGLIPVAIGIAILKYRLYDIDLVINKTLVYGAMAAFITAVYIAIVVGIGHAVGSTRNLGLSILATALVAVGFQPVRERVQRFANRLVYGKRATPYEVLSEFSGGMSHVVATDELLPRMARIVAEGTGAETAEVWLHVGSELVREASWPRSNGQARSVVAVSANQDITLPDSDAVMSVRHHGELLGVIGIKKSPGDGVRPAEQRLLEDLASQAGLVLRNVALIEEVKASRQRLVTAQDEERRRLERDLHDGAQQRLVAISLALRMARTMADPATDASLCSQLDTASEELGRALSELREFARGIHPAILTERGLVPALELLAERFTVPTTVDGSLVERLPATVETTAYFVVSEALANVGKYAQATHVDVCVGSDGESLSVEVVDDGIGGADPTRGTGLRGLADRAAAVDGILEVDSPVGRGTRLALEVPIPAKTGTPL